MITAEAAGKLEKRDKSAGTCSREQQIGAATACLSSLDHNGSPLCWQATGLGLSVLGVLFVSAEKPLSSGAAVGLFPRLVPWKPRRLSLSKGRENARTNGRYHILHARVISKSSRQAMADQPLSRYHDITRVFVLHDRCWDVCTWNRAYTSILGHWLLLVLDQPFMRY